jgi:ATP synthase protein I
MADPIDPKRLDALDKKLEAVRKGKEPEIVHENHYKAAQVGWRMVTELVVGLLLGFGIGFGLDKLFGTAPLFMIVFIMFGFAAGVRTMMRTAKEIQEENSKMDAPAAPSGQDKMYDDD